jgi:phosphohistidine phosphatase
MRRLILMRHSKAEPATGTGDHARPLSDRGRNDAVEAGRALAGLLVPDFALVSDSVRTIGTFERVARGFASGLPHRSTPRLYGATPEVILEEVAMIPGEVRDLLVIGHNPGLGDLARRLAGVDPARPAEQQPGLAALAAHFPTSCFAVLALDAEGWDGLTGPGRLDVLSTMLGRTSR